MKNDFQIIDVEIQNFIYELPMNSEVEVYTDGSCKGNPGPGGWGAILIWKNKRATLSGYDAQTTNNRMELTAAIEVLKIIPSNIKINIFTDSSYLRDGITSWINLWKFNSWKTLAEKPVKNQDLWKQLDILVSTHKVNWNWVKGHSDCTNNNNADFIARSAINSNNNE